MIPRLFSIRRFCVLFPLFLSIAPPLLLGAGVTEEKSQAEIVDFDFSGAPAPGTVFSFRIRSIRTRNCEMKVLGMERPPVRRDTREVLAAGSLFYKAKRIEAGTLVRELEFTPDSIAGFINGERFDFPEYSGKTFSITITADGPSIRLKKGSPSDSSAALSSNVLSGGTPASGRTSDPSVIPPELLYLLKAVFGHASDPPVNYLGRSARMERGRHTELDPSPVLQALRQAGIPADKEEIECFAEYDGSTLYMGIPTRRVNMLIQGAGIPGCDFKLEISLLYPYGRKNAAASGPVRISRRALFVAAPYLPEGNALLPGARLEDVETDMTDIQLIPEVLLPR